MCGVGGEVNPAIEQAGNACRARGEVTGDGLVEPLHQQPHGGRQVTAIEQCVDDLGVGGAGLEVGEVLDLLGPEGEVAAGGAGRLPRGQDVGRLGSRPPTTDSRFGIKIDDDGRSVSVPVECEGLEIVVQSIDEVVVTAGGRFGQGRSVGSEQPLHQRQQVLEPRVGNHVFAGVKQGELRLESEVVPGIGQGPAVDAAVEKITGLGKVFERFEQIASLGTHLGGCQRTLDLALEPDRRRRDRLGLLPCRFGESHPGIKQCQLTVLDLVGTVTGEVEVQLLADMSEGLLSLSGQLDQHLGPFPFGQLDVMLVESVSQTSDDRQEGGQGDGRIVGVGAGSTDCRCHQNGAGKDDGRILEHLRRIRTVFGHRPCPVDQRIEDDLSEDEAAEEALGVGRVVVPLTEHVCRPLVDRVQVVVGTDIDGQFVQVRRVEVGHREQIVRCALQHFDRPRDQVPVGAG